MRNRTIEARLFIRTRLDVLTFGIKSNGSCYVHIIRKRNIKNIYKTKNYINFHPKLFIFHFFFKYQPQRSYELVSYKKPCNNI